VSEPQPFAFQIDHGLIERVSAGLPSHVAFVAAEPWELAEARWGRPPDRVIEAVNTDHAYLRDLAATMPPVDAVVGLGGGSAIDTAKFVAWRTGLPLWQFPSVASVDAVFTRPAGVREDHRVRYVGQAVPQLVAADLGLLLGAPPELNQAGVGDILSCHTGLFDWRLAQGHPGAPPLEEELVALSLRLVEGLRTHAGAIRAANADGIRFILESYREEGAVGDAVGHSFFEEGSEHYFAYCLEHLTGMHLIHGELIALGVLIMVIAQENQVDETAALIGSLGVRCLPAALGLPFDVVADVLDALPGYCAEERFPLSVAHTLAQPTRDAILSRLRLWEKNGLS